MKHFNNNIFSYNNCEQKNIIKKLNIIMDQSQQKQHGQQKFLNNKEKIKNIKDNKDVQNTKCWLNDLKYCLQMFIRSCYFISICMLHLSSYQEPYNDPINYHQYYSIITEQVSKYTKSSTIIDDQHEQQDTERGSSSDHHHLDKPKSNSKSAFVSKTLFDIPNPKIPGRVIFALLLMIVVIFISIATCTLIDKISQLTTKLSLSTDYVIMVIYCL